MIKTIIILSMLFLHIVDDYYLQGILASMKQKSWWEKNAPDDLYKHDYIVVLIEHAFSWTFMIILPILIAWWIGIIQVTVADFVLMFVTNLVLHAYIDNEKANRKTINLIVDQSAHISQIICTAIHFLFVME